MKDTERTDAEHEILKAARELLADGGTDAVTMRSVADRVGLSATAIYHYFESKEDLIARVVEDGYRSFGDYLEAAAERFPVGSLERLVALGEAYVRFGIEHQEYFRVLFSLQPHTPREVHELPSDGGYPLLHRSVQEAMSVGLLRQDEPELVALLLWTVVHGLVTLGLACSFRDLEQAPGAPSSPTELLRALERMIMNGIGTGEPRGLS